MCQRCFRVLPEQLRDLNLATTPPKSTAETVIDDAAEQTADLMAQAQIAPSEHSDLAQAIADATTVGLPLP